VFMRKHTGDTKEPSWGRVVKGKVWFSVLTELVLLMRKPELTG
jgi:hypothetical protein